MIIPKMLINQVANSLTKHFRLEKIMSYVFEDNELDKKVKNLEDRLKLLEKMAHSPKDFKCKYKKEKEIKYG